MLKKVFLVVFSMVLVLVLGITVALKVQEQSRSAADNRLPGDPISAEAMLTGVNWKTGESGENGPYDDLDDATTENRVTRVVESVSSKMSSNIFLIVDNVRGNLTTTGEHKSWIRGHCVANAQWTVFGDYATQIRMGKVSYDPSVKMLTVVISPPRRHGAITRDEGQISDVSFETSYTFGGSGWGEEGARKAALDNYKACDAEESVRLAARKAQLPTKARKMVEELFLTVFKVAGVKNVRVHVDIEPTDLVKANLPRKGTT